MNSLPQPDLHHLDAAIGWCDLKDYRSAAQELKKIERTLQSHPDVLEIKWRVAMHSGEFEKGLKIARKLFDVRPERWVSWAFLVSSFLELKEVELAYEILQQARLTFEEFDMLHYDLACVCCLLNKLGEAKAHLAQAIELGGEKIKKRAQHDEDLKALWGNLEDVEI